MRKLLGLLLVMSISLSTIARAATGDPPTTNAEINVCDDHFDHILVHADQKINLDENFMVLYFDVFSPENAVCKKPFTLTNDNDWEVCHLFKTLDLGKRY
jgi:hypothetical protein